MAWSVSVATTRTLASCFRHSQLQERTTCKDRTSVSPSSYAQERITMCTQGRLATLTSAMQWNCGNARVLTARRLHGAYHREHENTRTQHCGMQLPS